MRDSRRVGRMGSRKARTERATGLGMHLTDRGTRINPNLWGHSGLRP